MAKAEQDPEIPYLLPGGQRDVPDIPYDADTPCRNEEFSGRRLPDGEVVDLWFGDGWGRNRTKDAMRHAASLCWSVCAIEHPEAFEACALYQSKFKPTHGVYGGVIPGTARP